MVELSVTQLMCIVVFYTAIGGLAGYALRALKTLQSVPFESDEVDKDVERRIQKR